MRCPSDIFRSAQHPSLTFILPRDEHDAPERAVPRVAWYAVEDIGLEPNRTVASDPVSKDEHGSQKPLGDLFEAWNDEYSWPHHPSEDRGDLRI